MMHCTSTTLLNRVNQYLTGDTSKTKIAGSNTTMTEMEQRTRMRYAFAMSSFARMFTPNSIPLEMRRICQEWSEIEEQPPTGDLYQVDRYFLELWKRRNEPITTPP